MNQLTTRCELSAKISKTIEVLNQNTESQCDEIWKIFFQKSKHIDSGTYGDVFVTHLPQFQNVPVVVKRTKRINLNEVIPSLLVSALVECGANPHFNILYGHVHCENKLSKSVTSQRDIPWVEGEKQLQLLHSELKQNPSKKTVILNQMAKIEQRMFPTKENVEKLRLFKNQKEKQLNELSTTVVFFERQKHENDMKILDALNDTFMYMQEIRSQINTTYELLIMEFADYSFDNILKPTVLLHVHISSIFQVCMGFLSMISIFGIVQNDMHL